MNVLKNSSGRINSLVFSDIILDSTTLLPGNGRMWTCGPFDAPINPEILGDEMAGIWSIHSSLHSLCLPRLSLHHHLLHCWGLRPISEDPAHDKQLQFNNAISSTITGELYLGRRSEGIWELYQQQTTRRGGSGVYIPGIDL